MSKIQFQCEKSNKFNVVRGISLWSSIALLSIFTYFIYLKEILKKKAKHIFEFSLLVDFKFAAHIVYIIYKDMFQTI